MLPLIFFEFLWLPVIYVDFLWFPMISFGCLWFPLIFCDFLWFLLKFLWFLLTSLNFFLVSWIVHCFHLIALNFLWALVLSFDLFGNRLWDHSKSVDHANCYKLHQSRAQKTQTWPTWWKNKFATLKLYLNGTRMYSNGIRLVYVFTQMITNGSTLMVD